MDSFAFWCKQKNEIEDHVNVEMHFNLWTEYSDDKKEPFLDVGIKVDHFKDISEILFYVPFRIKRTDISDLGNILSSNKSVLNAVFNESFITRDENIPKQITVIKNETPEFRIYSLDMNRDIQITDKFDGSVISIKTKGITNIGDLKYYFRFRIKSNDFNELIMKRQPKNILLQSAISVDYFIDFRFNDIRTISESLIEEMQGSSVIPIKLTKIHFLLLTRADIDLNSNRAVGERKLENSIWKNYIGFEPKTIIVANHWKLKEEENCIIYIKFKVNRCNWTTMGAYIIVLGIFSVVFNVLAAIIQK